MKTKDMSKEARNSLLAISRGVYLRGNCFDFAIALHRSLGWPIIGLMENKIPIHVFVKEPNGSLRDIRGEVSSKNAGKPFGIHPPHDLQEVSEDDLITMNDIFEYRIIRAQEVAETLFPDLPYKTRVQDKFLEFTRELEELSKRTGLWIRSPFITTRPILTTDDEESSGEHYEIEPTPDGMCFMIDRAFE